jgi:hypothetical protein
MAKNDAKQANANGAETVSGYFRQVFAERPELLDARSNDELLQRWLRDHPGQKGVPNNIRQNLSNVKSVLRKRGRTSARRRAKFEASALPAGTAPPAPRASKGLALLEERIDECLTAARGLDRDALADVINHLRRARNEVVWTIGQ